MGLFKKTTPQRGAIVNVGNVSPQGNNYISIDTLYYGDEQDELIYEQMKRIGENVVGGYCTSISSALSVGKSWEKDPSITRYCIFFEDGYDNRNFKKELKNEFSDTFKQVKNVNGLKKQYLKRGAFLAKTDFRKPIDEKRVIICKSILDKKSTAMQCAPKDPLTNKEERVARIRSKIGQKLKNTGSWAQRHPKLTMGILGVCTYGLGELFNVLSDNVYEAADALESYVISRQSCAYTGTVKDITDFSRGGNSCDVEIGIESSEYVDLPSEDSIVIKRNLIDRQFDSSVNNEQYNGEVQWWNTYEQNGINVPRFKRVNHIELDSGADHFIENHPVGSEITYCEYDIFNTEPVGDGSSTREKAEIYKNIAYSLKMGCSFFFGAGLITYYMEKYHPDKVRKMRMRAARKQVKKKSSKK